MTGYEPPRDEQGNLIPILGLKFRGMSFHLYQFALRKRLLVKQPCVVCGSTHAPNGHHEDYSYPLRVVWLCQKHHRMAHRGRGPYMDHVTPATKEELAEYLRAFERDKTAIEKELGIPTVFCRALGHKRPPAPIKNAKLTEADVASLRSKVASGEMTQMQAARAFGVSQSTASNIVRGKLWKHVKPAA